MMQEESSKLIRKEISRLKKKYKYKDDVAKAEVDIKGEPVRGNANAKVTIVEFSDFECPFCIRSQASTKKVREVYGDKVKFVFKDFPLSFHPSAMNAHLASNCMYKENPANYWNFFDEVFSPTRPANILQADTLKNLAIKHGANPATYEKCVMSADTKKEVEGDISEGEKLGVNGTPAFFINGRLLSGALPFEEFQSIIDEELN